MKPKKKSKRPGRPKLADGPRPLLETRADSELVAKVVAMASADGRTKAGMVLRLIKEAVAAREKKRRRNDEGRRG